jgi:hypothetical protein
MNCTQFIDRPVVTKAGFEFGNWECSHVGTS